jgi:hypothetical protein
VLEQTNHPSEALDRRRENVSDAPLGLDHLGCAWVLFQLAAKTQNLHVDAAIEDVLVDSRRLQQMLPAERALGSIKRMPNILKQAVVIGAGMGGLAAAKAATGPTASTEQRQPISHNSDYPSAPETRSRAALRWLIDCLALAGAGMAGVHVGVLLDPSDASDGQTNRKDRPDGIS